MSRRRLRPLSLRKSRSRRRLSDAVDAGRGDNQCLAYFAAAFRNRPVSAIAIAIAGMLTEHFRVPIKIEQFVGSRDYLGPNQRAILGKGAPTLGNGATLGKRLWRCDARMRLHIGPLDRKGLDLSLPNGKAAVALARMLRHFAVSYHAFEVRLMRLLRLAFPLNDGPEPGVLLANTLHAREELSRDFASTSNYSPTTPTLRSRQ